MPLKGDPSMPRRIPRQSETLTRDYQRVSSITTERRRLNPSPLAQHFTNFKTDYTDPIAIPGNVIGGPTQVTGGAKHLDVGQLPEK